MLITLYRTDKQGRNHYYSLNDRQGHLFSEYAFTVNWGMAPTAGREKVHVFDNRSEMDAKLQQLLQDRISDGYRVLYSFFRNHEYRYLRPALRSASVS